MKLKNDVLGGMVIDVKDFWYKVGELYNKGSVNLKLETYNDGKWLMIEDRSVDKFLCKINIETEEIELLGSKATDSNKYVQVAVMVNMAYSFLK